jgi:Uma2 family endonuclease
MSQHAVETPGITEQVLSMSYDEFLSWADEDTHAEWVGGKVIVFMPPKTVHQRMTMFLAMLLFQYVRLLNLGEVLTAPFEMRARPDGPAREPDLLFVAHEHLDRLTPERLGGPADLIVEIVSDSSLARDRADKFYEYQEAGVREYWIIDPRPGKERADFYQLMPDDKYQAALPDEQGRYHSLVLPGFWLQVDWLWQEPLPDPLQALRELAPDALRSALGNA